MKHRRRNTRWNALAIGAIVAVGIAVCAVMFWKKEDKGDPRELLVQYMDHIEKREYDEMYDMVDADSVAYLGREGFITRNANIYEGIEVRNLKIENAKVEENGEIASVSYEMSFDTVAGEIRFENQAAFIYGEDGYRLLWKDRLIFPNLRETDKIRVSTLKAERGNILDRNGKTLAGKGLASSVGIVPGKLGDRESSLQSLADLLEMDVAAIESKLAAAWVKDDSFVPIATIPKVQEIDLMGITPEESVVKEHERQMQMLNIPGVMISDVEVRSYSLGEAASHLIGYVQNVTEEDLEEHAGEGYDADSVIGRNGMEGLYEKELKGKDGSEISIVSQDGDVKEVVAKVLRENGQDIRLTIDSDLQKTFYEQFKDDKGCSVAINPYTGEVLALISTPSYDNNDFIRGIGQEKWTFLSENEDKPLYNRFRQVWCPGSTFKPIVAGIALKTGAVDPYEDFGNEGRSWQKDDSWGSYHVTTVHPYEPVIMKNAILYSDNIYFAKTALRIGADDFMESLDGMGFNQDMPFEIEMTWSQYANEGGIATEIQLADSGYGQGQVLVNPLHLASIYTAFLNNGDMIKPYLRYTDNAAGEVWIPGVFDTDSLGPIMEGMVSVVNDPEGTGYAAHRDDMVLAGKTGTAEIKAAKDDDSGTETGWFAVFTTDQGTDKPILIVSMVEDMKDLGGGGYVVKKDKAALDAYLGIPPEDVPAENVPIPTGEEVPEGEDAVEDDSQ